MSAICAISVISGSDFELRIGHKHKEVPHADAAVGAWSSVRDYKPGIGLSNNVQFRDVWLAKNRGCHGPHI